MPKEKASARRYRNFGAVLYPESAPKNWREIIGEWKVPVYVSPLHDKDIDPQSQPKKSHHHVLIAFEGVKTQEQARELLDQIKAVGCEIVQSLRGYARYLCHLDNPEKAQYNPEEVITFGGADYAETIGLPTDKYKAIDEMIEWCEVSGIESYRDLLNHARTYRRDWFRVLCDSATLVMKEYLKSKTWEIGTGRARRLTETDGHDFARAMNSRVDDDGVIFDDPLPERKRSDLIEEPDELDDTPR